MPRSALLVGIDHYDHLSPLRGCVADARAMRDLLQANEDGSPNYECRLLTSDQEPRITQKVLRAQWNKLFSNSGDDLLFYFSGHGAPPGNAGGFLVTQEGEKDDVGLPMDELLVRASNSRARSILLILDCCHSGSCGNPAINQGAGNLENQAQLREGITILAASRPAELAFEINHHGVFTRLVLDALSGGAADVRGNVSAASIYAYVEQALGSWEQRPLYKSYANCLAPVRRCEPHVPDSLLRELPIIFEEEADIPLWLAPSFEFSHPSAQPDHVALFNKLKILRNARLLTTEEGKDLFFLAMDSGWVKLSPLGQLYWNLAKRKRI